MHTGNKSLINPNLVRDLPNSYEAYSEYLSIPKAPSLEIAPVIIETDEKTNAKHNVTKIIVIVVDILYLVLNANIAKGAYIIEVEWKPIAIKK